MFASRVTCQRPAIHTMAAAPSFIFVGTVAFFFLLLAGLSLAQEPPVIDEEDARRQHAEARQSGRWDDAIEQAQAIAFIEYTAYMESLQEIVRLQCLKGDKEAAYRALDELLEAQYWNFRALRNDEELSLITTEERFRKAVRGAWAKQYLEMLERESRAAMQYPERIMADLAFRPDEVVADVGAGSGYFTVPIARAVSGGGKVLALDIRQEMLDFIEGRIAAEGLGNVELGLVEPDDPLLPAGLVDTIFMVDVFHYIKDRTAYASKLKKGLAPGGRLVVIDFRYDPEAEREFAPPPEQQVARKDLDADLARAGFKVRASFDYLPQQYFVIYEVD
jgi:SAM-dependent methyltransferase